MNIMIAIAILLAYTLIMIKIGGEIPSSLSSSVFDLPYKLRWIWCVVIFLVCFLCVPTYIEKTGEYTQFLAFLSIAGLGFVGAAPLVKSWEDKMQYKVHEIGAIVCAVCSQLVLVFNAPMLLVCWLPFMAYGVCRLRHRHYNWRTLTFWAETVCFTNTFSYCLV